MGATGTGTFNFGSTPGTNYVTTTVTGQAGIVSGSQVEAYMMGDSTATHNVVEHMIVPLNIVCGNIVAGTGFDVVATTQWRIDGTFLFHWVWF